MRKKNVLAASKSSGVCRTARVRGQYIRFRWSSQGRAAGAGGGRSVIKIGLNCQPINVCTHDCFVFGSADLGTMCVPVTCRRREVFRALRE